MIDLELVPVVAARFKALAEPARLAILAALYDRERSVNELTAATGRAQPNVSQHLASLARSGLVASRREGNRVFYRIADPYLARICKAVCDSLAARVQEDRKWMARLPRGRRPGARSRG